VTMIPAAQVYSLHNRSIRNTFVVASSIGRKDHLQQLRMQTGEAGVVKDVIRGARLVPFSCDVVPFPDTVGNGYPIYRPMRLGVCI